MDVVVTGRHCTISPQLKELVRDRIVTVERLRDRVIRVEVEFSATDGTKNPSDAVEVQITLRSRGPVVRAEAKANDKTLAFEQAFDRLKVQLRKAADRRKTHRGLRTAIFAEEPASALVPEKTENEPEEPTYEVAGLVVNGDGPRGSREGIRDRSAQPGPGIGRDGTGRARLLPLPGFRHGETLGGLSPQGLQLRCHPPERERLNPTGSAIRPRDPLIRWRSGPRCTSECR